MEDFPLLYTRFRVGMEYCAFSFIHMGGGGVFQGMDETSHTDASYKYFTPSSFSKKALR